MTVISLAMLATICQIPDFKDSSSLTCTPQSQEVRPRNPLHASSPSRPSKPIFALDSCVEFVFVFPFPAAPDSILLMANAEEENKRQEKTMHIILRK